MTTTDTAPNDLLTTEANPPYVPSRTSGILVETMDDKVNALHCVRRHSGKIVYYRYDRGAPQWSGGWVSDPLFSDALVPIVFTGSNWNLDVLCRGIHSGVLFHAYATTYHEAPPYQWTVGPELSREVNGSPAVCRWGTARKGLDVVAPVASGGFQHWYRDDFGTWIPTAKPYSNSFSGLAMVPSHGKTLFISAVETNGTLWWIERPIEKWFSRNVGSGFTGQPALVENTRAPSLLYDLVVPNAKGQLSHFEIRGWHRPEAVFGVSGRIYHDVGLVWSQTTNQLECVACPEDVTLPPEHYINRYDGKGWVSGAPFR